MITTDGKISVESIMRRIYKASGQGRGAYGTSYMSLSKAEEIAREIHAILLAQQEKMKKAMEKPPNWVEEYEEYDYHYKKVSDRIVSANEYIDYWIKKCDALEEKGKKFDQMMKWAQVGLK